MLKATAMGGLILDNERPSTPESPTLRVSKTFAFPDRQALLSGRHLHFLKGYSRK
jgi:hypothetical protein